MKQILIITILALIQMSFSGCHKSGGSKNSSGETGDKVQKGDPYLPAAAKYVGSEQCASCHFNYFVGWSKSLHNKPLKTFAELGTTILVNDHNNNGLNDFQDGLNFNDPNFATTYGYTNPFSARIPNAPILSTDGSKYYIQIGIAKYEFQRVQGGNGYWKQRYHTKIGNAYYVLPVQYNEVLKRYSGYNPTNWWSGGTSTPLLNAPYGDPLLLQQVSTQLVTSTVGPSASSWDNRCAVCHQTGLAVEYRETTPGIWEVVTGYSELNIGCESCHGPGEDHVTSANPADIINPQNYLTEGRVGLYKAAEVCGRCHQRGEGLAQFIGTLGTVQKKVEAPAKLVASSFTKAAFPVLGESILSYYNDAVGVWVTAGNGAASKTGTYDTITNFPVYEASNQHHQQWEDMEQWKHGASKQGVLSQLTCWSCHDMHSVTKPHLMRASINNLPTDVQDNTLCLACHAGAGTLVGATSLDQVKYHISQNAAAGGQAKADKITAANYLQPIKADGTQAKYGMNYYRLGSCVSCHMPYTPSSSGVRYNDANGKTHGDITNHTMKIITTSPGGSTCPTSCSGCHS